MESAYQYPTSVEVASIAKDGCVMSLPGFCGQIKPFENKEQCFDSQRECLIQLTLSPMEDDRASREYRDMQQVCDNQFQFCAQCGKKGYPPCKLDEFAFQRKQ